MTKDEINSVISKLPEDNSYNFILYESLDHKKFVIPIKIGDWIGIEYNLLVFTFIENNILKGKFFVDYTKLMAVEIILK